MVEFEPAFPTVFTVPSLWGQYTSIAIILPAFVVTTLRRCDLVWNQLVLDYLRKSRGRSGVMIGYHAKED